MRSRGMTLRCTPEGSHAKHKFAISRLELNWTMGIQLFADEARVNSSMERLIAAVALDAGNL